MGSRGNIVVVQHSEQEADGEVYLYTHWGGEGLPLYVQSTLARRERWDDESYLARMLFCSLLGPDELGEDTGLGISTYLGDNEYPLLKVDTALATVSMVDPDGDYPTRTWSFEQFVALQLEPDNPWSGLGYSP